MCDVGSAGAPETRGTCLKGAATGSGRCQEVRLASPQTHVFDVAVKRWLLPLVVDLGQTPELLALVAQMRIPDVSKRPDFTRALEMLDQLELTSKRSRI